MKGELVVWCMFILDIVAPSSKSYLHDDLPLSLSKLNVDENLWSFPTENWRGSSRRSRLIEAEPHRHGAQSRDERQKLDALSVPDKLESARSKVQNESDWNAVRIDAHLAARIRGYCYDTQGLKRAICAWNLIAPSFTSSHNQESVAAVDKCIKIVADSTQTAVRSRADTLLALSCFFGA